MLDKQFDRTQTLFDQPNGANYLISLTAQNYMMILFDWTEQTVWANYLTLNCLSKLSEAHPFDAAILFDATKLFDGTEQTV